MRYNYIITLILVIVASGCVGSIDDKNLSKLSDNLRTEYERDTSKTLHIAIIVEDGADISRVAKEVNETTKMDGFYSKSDYISALSKPSDLPKLTDINGIKRIRKPKLAAPHN